MLSRPWRKPGQGHKVANYSRPPSRPHNIVISVEHLLFIIFHVLSTLVFRLFAAAYTVNGAASQTQKKHSLFLGSAHGGSSQSVTASTDGIHCASSIYRVKASLPKAETNLTSPQILNNYSLPAENEITVKLHELCTNSSLHRDTRSPHLDQTWRQKTINYHLKVENQIILKSPEQCTNNTSIVTQH